MVLRSVSVRSEKNGHPMQQHLRNLREFVAVVVDDAQGSGRADRVAVKVGEHRLAALEPHIKKQYDDDGLVAQIRDVSEEASGSPFPAQFPLILPQWRVQFARDHLKTLTQIQAELVMRGPRKVRIFRDLKKSPNWY